ncbi:2'-5' RNA ligase [Limnochorda pilosa]|uniref:RNA 2',3'-cyclic phosphodiesterase n=1 Tax=Limnochorda pilosa TaxID=1555112 RepID=A0A0K2SKN8_LIMPI|nr:2'-5' RNA ligase [Limnochorda pilosa]
MSPPVERALRVFVAVSLSPPLRQAVRTLQHSWSATGAQPRWVDPENLHVTLRFLGLLPEGRVGDVTGAAEEASRDVGPFLLGLGSCGRFPPRGSPRVLWVGITDGARELAALASALDAALRRRRFPREERAFRPHVTVARIREGDRLPGLEAWLEGCGDHELGQMRVEAIHVMESQLRPQGPLYRPLAVVPLGRAGR